MLAMNLMVRCKKVGASAQPARPFCSFQTISVTFQAWLPMHLDRGALARR
jgi:hypothetical protein